jgi:hypothetical protein
MDWKEMTVYSSSGQQTILTAWILASALVPVDLIENCELINSSDLPPGLNHCSEFDDPDSEERTLYVRYWQKKLKNNKEISFPEGLVIEVVDSTEDFSFAYLKEALYVQSISLILPLLNPYSVYPHS